MITFSKKLEYHFLVENTAIENAFFLYKTVLSKTSVKTNRMGSRKGIYHEKWGIATNYFFMKI